MGVWGCGGGGGVGKIQLRRERSYCSRVSWAQGRSFYSQGSPAKNGFVHKRLLLGSKIIG